MYRVLPGLAALSVVLIAGCGSSESTSPTAAPAANEQSATESGSTTADSAATSDNPEVKIENLIADCMKQQGFTYIPHPSVYETADSPRLRYGGGYSYLQPDSDVRKWREKYGFGFAATLVYPNDPQVQQRETAANPNDAIVAALDSARKKAYNKAFSGAANGEGYDPKTASRKDAGKLEKDFNNSCQGKASELRTKDAKAAQPSTAKKAANHKLVLKFRNDSDVADVAQKYSDCLKGRGYKVSFDNTEPISVYSAVTQSLSQNYEAATKNKSAAKQALTKEIKLALDDVDCRTAYAKLVRTKYPMILDAGNTEGAG